MHIFQALTLGADCSLRLIVYEKSGAWAQALRRELAAERIRISETRSLVECWEELERSWPALVALELSQANADGLLCRCSRLDRDFAGVPCVVFASRGLESFEGLAREAGALYFTTSPRQLAPLRELVRRRLTQLPRAFGTATEQIMAELPWGDDGHQVLNQLNS